MITKITPQQEAAISFYQQKWQKISRSTEPIDRDKAITALNDANDCHGGEPFLEIAFFDSPCAAFNLSSMRLCLIKLRQGNKTMC